MEGIFGAAAMLRRIGQWPDDVVEFEHRARPSMRHDQPQGIGVWPADMEEMEIQAINFSAKLIEGVELPLDRPPLIGICPVLDERLQLVCRHALRPVGSNLAVG